jgi:hypothetical protein
MRCLPHDLIEFVYDLALLVDEQFGITATSMNKTCAIARCVSDFILTAIYASIQFVRNNHKSKSIGNAAHVHHRGLAISGACSLGSEGSSPISSSISRRQSRESQGRSTP